MHKLIARQLDKATRPDGTVDVGCLCDLVSEAYKESDTRQRINSHALDVLQDELETANRRFLEEAEARFTVVMENVGEAVVIIGDDGVIETFNKAAERIFGYQASEVVGRNVTILMTEGDAARHDEILRTHLLSGERKIVGHGREVVARRQNGEEFPIDLAVGEVVSAGRRRFIGVIRDISQHKQIERDLRESEGRFRDLAGSASDWFWETDVDYRLEFVSERIAGTLGVKPSAILGSSFFDIGLGDGDPEQAATHHATLAQRQPFREVVFHVGPEEGTDAKTIRISGRPVFDAKGTFVGYRGIGVDITRETAAERRAKQAQQQLVDAIESIDDAIAVYDAQDRLVVSNRHYQNFFGGNGHHIPQGTTFEQTLHRLMEQGTFQTDGDPPEVWLERRLALHRAASGEPFVVQLENGQWILSREYRTRDGGIVGVRTDITELKQRETELDTLRRRYQLILDSAGEGILGLGSGGRITFANRMACDILRVDADTLVGICFHAFVQPFGRDGEPYPFEASAVRRAYRDGLAEQVSDDVFWAFDGTELHVDYLVAPIVENEEMARAVVVFRDAGPRIHLEATLANQHRELERLVDERTVELRNEVDVRARTEAALRASRERLKTIADSLFEGVLVIDRTGHLIFANTSARTLLGIDSKQGDIEGHPLDTLMLLRQRDGFVDFANSPWQQVIAGGHTVRDDDAMFGLADKGGLFVAYACSPLKEDDEVRGAIISFRDIHALKQAQREAEQSSRLATVGQLAAGIAHEINTPIQYVGDNLRFINTSVAKLVTVLDAAHATGNPAVEAAMAAVKLPFLLAELPVAVTESLEGVGQIARIVLSMKEFSHPGTTAKTSTDLNRAIESTLTVSRNTWKHVAELDKDLDSSLPPVVCLAGEMNQVFLNLVINAAHAIESSGKPLPGRLSISTARLGDQVEIRIADSGSGIPDTIRDRIFDPFFTTKEVGKGTGQGLAICRDVVVTKHGGQIEVDGRPGVGAIFIIRLPINGNE